MIFVFCVRLQTILFGTGALLSEPCSQFAFKDVIGIRLHAQAAALLT